MNKVGNSKGFVITLVALTIGLIFTIVLALCMGHYSIEPLKCIKMIFYTPLGNLGDWTELDESVLFGLRLPRILGALIVGVCLAISGAAYQSVFQNPLVSPDILGVSSGACVGAATAILLHLSKWLIMVFAFSGGILAVAATVTIPYVLRSESNIMLVLSGIVVGGITGSIMGIIKYIADPESELPQIIYWTMGSLDGITLPTIFAAIFPVLLCISALIKMSWWIDVISLGEIDAKSLGADVKKIRLVLICTATLLTAISVCMCGTIGWIGLVIPHFARMLVGSSNTKLLPVASLLGAIFLLIVDTISRNIASVEIPLSIITGLVGAPFYAWLLYRQRESLS